MFKQKIVSLPGPREPILWFILFRQLLGPAWCVCRTTSAGFVLGGEYSMFWFLKTGFQASSFRYKASDSTLVRHSSKKFPKTVVESCAKTPQRIIWVYSDGDSETIGWFAHVKVWSFWLHLFRLSGYRFEWRVNHKSYPYPGRCLTCFFILISVHRLLFTVVHHDSASSMTR